MSVDLRTSLLSLLTTGVAQKPTIVDEVAGRMSTPLLKIVFEYSNSLEEFYDACRNVGEYWSDDATSERTLRLLVYVMDAECAAVSIERVFSNRTLVVLTFTGPRTVSYSWDTISKYIPIGESFVKGEGLVEICLPKTVKFSLHKADQSEHRAIIFHEPLCAPFFSGIKIINQGMFLSCLSSTYSLQTVKWLRQSVCSLTVRTAFSETDLISERRFEQMDTERSGRDYYAALLKHWLRESIPWKIKYTAQ